MGVILVLEVAVACVAVILFLCALLYYSSIFVEERMVSFTKLLKVLNVIVLTLILLFPFTSLPNTVFGLIFTNNLMWAILIFRGFPFSNYVSPEFFVGFILTAFSHLFLMLHFLRSSAKSLITTVSYFVLYVWLFPILIIISLSAVEDSTSGQPSTTNDTSPKPKTESFIKKFFDRMLKKAEDVLPHSGDKYE